MKKLLFIFLCSLYLSAFADSNFALSEHMSAGAQIVLHFSKQRNEQNPLLHFKNGLVLNFATMLSMGDLYGTPEQPISFGQTIEEQRHRFLLAFTSLTEKNDAVYEANLLSQLIMNELDYVQTAMRNGESAEQAFQSISNEIDRQANCITGGGCGSYDWWLVPGRYLQLALNNHDHFAPFAERAYAVGHQLAIEQAILASTSQRREDLELAYAMDGFACHFLSDLFAAGHLRTPRNELALKATPTAIGSLLAGYMHNEENHHGLPVHNKRGEHWRSYGDFAYFNEASRANREHLLTTLQQSVDEVFAAYNQGQQSTPSTVANYIPHYDEYGAQSKQSISPLFYWDKNSKQVLRRKDISNVYDRHWTSNWWGWSTLLALREQYGMQAGLKGLWLQLQEQKQLKAQPGSRK